MVPGVQHNFKTHAVAVWSAMQCMVIIEIGLEQAPTFAFEHVKSLLMGPNNTKNSSLKCDILITNYE
jgi:hypothetical protein